jgi:5-methylcytosine-specific restriction endonuclease McrA
MGYEYSTEFLESCNYVDYLRSEHWRALRANALQAYDFRCAICNSGNRLQVHHRTYERLAHELPRDVIVLCYACHKLFHEHGKLALPKG